MCAKYYENPTMLSRVIAKNVGDVFLRHTVELMHVLSQFTFSDITDMSTFFPIEN